MGNIEWKEVASEREEWKRQIDIMFCEIIKIGSLVFYDGNLGWSYIIDGIEDFLFADTEEDAKKELTEIITSYCDAYIAHYTAIKESIDRL